MRMTHYYSGLAVLLVPALLATLVTGAFHSGTQLHLTLGLFTAIGCVAQNTLLILFAVVTGRVLKQAIAARSLPRLFLDELNEFFARRLDYPTALLAATCAVAAAVLGYGTLIGVPAWIHMLLGLASVVVNLGAIPLGLRTLRLHQVLLDRAAALLDNLDEKSEPEEIGEPQDEWAHSLRMRWIIFGSCTWLPYLYWGALVWRGNFSKLSPLFLGGTAFVSALALYLAWASQTKAPEESES